MRFLQALLMAMARLAGGTLTAAWNFLDWSWRTVWSLVPGGGGGGTAMPPKTLDLPDVDEAHDAREEAQNKQTAADYILSSPERVVMAWAQSSKAERDTISLSKLSTDQIDWLEVRLSEAEIKILAAEKSEYKVAAALSGQEGAIPGVPSVPLARKKSGPNLQNRIMDFRANGLERPPAFIH